MAVYPHPTKGRGWWLLKVSRGRKAKQEVYTFQGTEAEAKAFEADIKGIPHEKGRQRVVDLYGRFKDWYALHRAEKTVTECDRAFKQLLDILGDRFVSLLRQSDYERYKHHRLAGGVSRRTINIELTYFRAFLRWAAGAGHEIGDAPELFAKRYTQPQRHAILTEAEADALIGHLTGDKRSIAQLMAWCGLRRNEATQLRRRHVDLSNRVLLITGKGNKQRLVPIIGDELEQSLKAACQGKKPDDYLFVFSRTGRPYANIKKALFAAAEKAGLDKRVGNHLLRHSFGVGAVVSGVNLRSLQLMLGHSDIRTTEIYTQLGADILQAEAQKMRHRSAPSEMSETAAKKKSRKNK